MSNDGSEGPGGLRRSVLRKEDELLQLREDRDIEMERDGENFLKR